MVSTTPVYDALKREAGSVMDALWGGAFSHFLAEIEEADVRVVTVHDDCDTAHPHHSSFPERGALLPAGRMWVESPSRLVDGLLFDHEGYNLGVRSGFLFETTDSDRIHWPYRLTTAKCVILPEPDKSPLIVPGKVVADTATYDCRNFSFADFERNRHGLLTAKDATEAQLHQMNHHLVEIDGRYIRAIPTKTVPAAYHNMPPYRQGIDFGTDELRAALATTCVEPWFPVDMANVDPVAAAFFTLFDHVLTRGPFITLTLLELIGSPSPAYRAITLPAPHGRNRESTLICPPWADPSNRM